jgi:hypothetical protein
LAPQPRHGESKTVIESGVESKVDVRWMVARIPAKF